MAKSSTPFTPSSARDRRPVWPAARNHGFEHALADAARRQMAVKILCKGDEFYRTFEPHILFTGQARQVFVGGNQTEDPAQPGEVNQWTAIEVGRLRDVQVTDRPFKVDSRFDRSDPQYSQGVICSVDG